MARQYKLIVNRGETEAKLFIHDNDEIEIVTPDDQISSEYLINKMILTKDLVCLMRKYNISQFKCNYEQE